MELLPSALFIIDIQEKLFTKMAHQEQLLRNVPLLIQACSLLEIPLYSSAQYPKGLGPTIAPIQSLLPAPPFEKTHFSCIQDPTIANVISKSTINSWILCGIETHVCLFQTARDLLKLQHRVTIPIDATSSRHILDYQTAIQELASQGARITTTETLLFEFLADAKHPHFKAVSALVK